MTISPDQSFRRQERVVAREIAGETLLVPLSDSRADMSHVFALNPVAAHIWQALDGATSVADIAAAVQRQFDVDPERAERDVLAFVGELAAADLLSSAGAD